MADLGIIGYGNMGSAIAQGYKNKYPKAKVLVFDKDKAKLKIAKFKTAKFLKELAENSNILLIAVKPQDIDSLLLELKRFSLKDKTLISIAAGIPISRLEKFLGKDTKIIRVMPNLGAFVQRSISAMAKNKNVSNKDFSSAKRIFAGLGKVLEVKEKEINAITAVSGSGPGYIYYFLALLEKAAQKAGFDKEKARRLVLETAVASVLLAEKSGMEFSELVKKVASKKGTTEAGLKEFKKAELGKTVEKAVLSALKRAKQISRRIVD